MDICAMKSARALLERAPEPERHSLLRLHSLCIDVLVLQRQLTFALAGETTLAPMIAHAVAGRLAEGAELLQRQWPSPIRPEGRLAVAALAEFRRHVLHTPDAVRRVIAGGEAGAQKDLLSASNLFIAAAQHVFAAVARHQEPVRIADVQETRSALREAEALRLAVAQPVELARTA